MIQLNILIVGGGIAGCSSAIALLRKGHTVTILERHPTCQALGGPVGLPSNATRVLIHYGMGEIMTKKDARESSAIYQRRYDTGAILGTQWGDATLDTYGFPLWMLARYRLQETLMQVAEERGAKILFNSQVVSIDVEKPAVELKDGTILEADLIIGADGIRSVIRDKLPGGTGVKSVSPLSTYNVDIPRSLLAADPSLSHLLKEANFWLGPSQIVVALNMPDLNDRMNLCLVNEEKAGEEGEWYKHGDLDKVRALYAHFDPNVRKMLELAKPEDCYIWRLSDMPPLEKWVSDSGKVVIVGDAVHAMLPYAGMGGSQCIEDSACLALCLERAESLSDLPKVLGAFETIRRPRVEWLIRKCREIAHMWHLPDGPEQQARDQFMFGKPPEGGPVWDGKNIDDPPEGPFNPLTFPYMEGYDVIDYTTRRLDQIMA